MTNMAKYAIVFFPLLLTNIVNYITIKPEKYAKNLMLQPPSYVFGIVWTIIYLLFGAFLYNVLYTNEPFLYWIIGLWCINFVVNLIWSPLVFNYEKYTLGVYLIVIMISTLIGLFISTNNIVSKNLLLPYISWLIIALILNVELVRKYTS